MNSKWPSTSCRSRNKPPRRQAALSQRNQAPTARRRLRVIESLRLRPNEHGVLALRPGAGREPPRLGCHRDGAGVSVPAPETAASPLTLRAVAAGGGGSVAADPAHSADAGAGECRPLAREPRNRRDSARPDAVPRGFARSRRKRNVGAGHNRGVSGATVFSVAVVAGRRVVQSAALAGVHPGVRSAMPGVACPARLFAGQGDLRCAAPSMAIPPRFQGSARTRREEPGTVLSRTVQEPRPIDPGDADRRRGITPSRRRTRWRRRMGNSTLPSTRAMS